MIPFFIGMRAYKKFPKSKGPLIPGKIYQSDRANKKLKVRVVYLGQDKVVHFGHPDYEDFLDHRDPDRRKNYLARSAKIKNKKANYTKDDPFSSNYWSRRILWKSRERTLKN